MTWIAYPETKVAWNADGFELTTPWLNVEVEISPDQRRDLPTVLEFLAELPIGYRSPRADCPPPTRVGPYELGQILELSHVPGQDFYDPVTVYGLLRRQRALGETAPGPSIYELLETLRQTNERRFFACVKMILAQTYAITSRCEDALEAGRASPGIPQETLLKFLNEERGHYRLVFQSLRDLGVSTDRRLRALPETDRSMRLLKECATQRPLSFACVVGAFEGLNHAEKDPLGEVLERSSKPRAALGVQRHYEINRDRGHSRIGEEFAAGLGGVTALEVAQAAADVQEIVELGLALLARLKEEVQRA